ncbi:MAG TPA: c-type cytochrome [Patescibacteria group bacterium]|nr:c-type cytochrome [Patescibacteria group bacterium]
MRALVIATALTATLGAAAGATAGPIDTPGFAKAFSCSACHGRAGATRADGVPILAGMPAWYLKKAMDDYAAGRRPSPEMEPFSKMVKTLGVDEVAAYFAAQPREASQIKVDRTAIGRAAAATCAVCHGEDGRGDQAKGTPDLTGQPPGYLLNQMKLFKAEKRSPGDAMLTSIKVLMKSLDDKTLADLAAYYSSLGR